MGLLVGIDVHFCSVADGKLVDVILDKSPKLNFFIDFGELSIR